MPFNHLENSAEIEPSFVPFVIQSKDQDQQGRAYYIKITVENYIDEATVKINKTDNK